MKFIALICFSSVFLAIETIQITQQHGSGVLTNLAPQAGRVEAGIASDSLESDVVLHIRYQCSNASLIFVKVQVQTESQPSFPIFRKAFDCLPHGEKRLKVIILKYARYITFKPSFYNKYSVFVDSAILRIWMTDLDQKWTTYERSEVKTEVPLKVILPFDRPDRILDKCFVWWYELLSKIPYSPTCPHEEEVVHILSYPMALDGGRVGLVKEMSPYKSKVLERTRMNNVRNANFSVMFWVYIVEYCPHSTLCSLMHHATWDDEYLTPLILINRKGQIHVEAILRKGESLAYLTLEDFVLPRKKWVQLVFTCHMSNVWQLYMKTDFSRWDKTTIEIPNSAAVYHYDVRGIYYFGGSELQPSFRGYFGEIIFFRRRVIDPYRMSQDHRKLFMFELQLRERDVKCQSYIKKISLIEMQTESLKQTIASKKSCPGFIKWLRDKMEEPELPQCKLEQAPKLAPQYAFVKRLVRGWVLTNQKYKISDVAALLLKQAYTILDESGLGGVSEIISLLKQSSCLGHHDASFMLATINNYGLFMDVDLKQSHSYLLSGSIYSNRLCLLSMANKHVFGLDGIPLDYNQAYVYYMNVAYLTKGDLLSHDDKDTITEAVRLTDEVLLKAQTSEDEDLFLWLKHQASKGMIDAQRRLAGMLYWGSQGVKRNTSSASSYYEAAASSGDAPALYDYGILLLKGHGVKQNITKALEHFQQAAAKRHAQAINTLGWYALVYKRNYTEAANYFEEAFKLGNPDAGHNLAHMLLSGIFPDLKRVEKVLAWDFFSKAALGGNFDSGLLVARYNMIGHPRTIRTPSLSIEWARYLAEQNPVIGRLLRSGLTSFRKQDWHVALVYYLMAANTGVEIANFNLAFLCEENYEYLTSSMQKECTWRHYNLSALRSSQSSNPYAWLKMADYHYMNHNVSLAANTYAEAAAKGDPQGYFSLATMIENQDKVPDQAFKTLGISFATSRNTEELLYHLYSRCRNSPKSDAFVPCSLALWKIKLYYFWIHHSTKVIGIAIPVFIIAFISTTSMVLSYVRNSTSLF